MIVKYILKVNSDMSPKFIAAYIPTQKRLIGTCISGPTSAIFKSVVSCTPSAGSDSSSVIDIRSQYVYPPNGHKTTSVTASSPSSRRDM
mmetsp:Transcript_6676/g.13482  ORF Transcript_6676/g.13482 Transcript_6676/m.13482 type:complete len:89 (+) Transcript_6676:603-869(+)